MGVRRSLWLLDDARIMGGGQLFTLRLAVHACRRRGAEAVRVLCPADSELARRAGDAGVPVAGLDFPNPAAVLAVLAAGLRLRRMLRGATPVLVGCSARAQAVVVAAGRGRDLVHLMHERDSARRRSVRLVQRRWGRVVAVGSNAGSAYNGAFVRNFLLPEDFERLGSVPSRPGDGTLAVLARLIPEKGVVELIQELEEVGGWNRLLVAGEPQDPDYAARVHAAATSRIEVMGHVDDVTPVLARCDAVIVPSIGEEGQPTVIVEALAAGRVVVVRRHVYSDDYSGLPVFPYGDLSQALAAARAAPAPDRSVVEARFGAEQALAAIEGTS